MRPFTFQRVIMLRAVATATRPTRCEAGSSELSLYARTWWARTRSDTLECHPQGGVSRLAAAGAMRDVTITAGRRLPDQQAQCVAKPVEGTLRGAQGRSIQLLVAPRTATAREPPPRRLARNGLAGGRLLILGSQSQEVQRLGRVGVATQQCVLIVRVQLASHDSSVGRLHGEHCSR